ncbi:MAG TPA: tetratricopeptide repeat protein, partial [Candidatus Methylomirabilis sp.]|nr:tetratricopeptide repeat protein [Candidatus Methylomirabilis sp.]
VHAYTQTIARTLAGLVWLRRGQLDRALPLLQKSLDACREKNLDVWRPIPSSLLGLTCVLLGRMDEGLRLLEDGVGLTEALGLRAYLALWTTHLGEGLLAAGQPERARATTQRALELAQLHKERGHQAWALRLRADIAARAGAAATEEAVDAYHQALSLGEELGMRPLVARSHLGLGQLHARAGRSGEAEEHLSEALRVFLLMDVRFWAARAAEGLMGLGHLFIVARHNVQLFEYLKKEFAGEPVTVILDRRQSERRQRDDGPGAEERRRGERRRHEEIQKVLRARGFVIAPDS